MMFQIAGLESLAKDNNVECYYYGVDQQLDYLNTETNFNPKLNHATHYLSMFENFNWKKNQHGTFNTSEVVPFKYVSLSFKDNHNYDGYFQSERFFVHNRSLITHTFEPSATVKQQLTKYDSVLSGTTCAIHVRRGDYVKLGDIHPPITPDYINQAMLAVGTVDRYLIFSDDIAWCKIQFVGPQYYFVENEFDYVELFLQTRCTHNITSNSSFSWWGAWLNNNENKIVTAPSRWFATPNIDSSDITPQTWIKI